MLPRHTTNITITSHRRWVIGTLHGANLGHMHSWKIPSRSREVLRGPTHSRPRSRLRSPPDSMTLRVPSALRTAPGECLWISATVAARRRSRFLRVRRLQVCSSRSRGATCTRVIRRRCRGKLTHTHTHNAAAPYRHLNRQLLFLTSLSLQLPLLLPLLLRHSHRVLSEKAGSPLRLDSCQSTTPTCSPASRTASRSFRLSAWACSPIRPTRRPCLRACNTRIIISIKDGSEECR